MGGVDYPTPGSPMVPHRYCLSHCTMDVSEQPWCILVLGMACLMISGCGQVPDTAANNQFDPVSASYFYRRCQVACGLSPGLSVKSWSNTQHCRLFIVSLRLAGARSAVGHCIQAGTLTRNLRDTLIDSHLCRRQHLSQTIAALTPRLLQACCLHVPCAAPNLRRSGPDRVGNRLSAPECPALEH